MALAIPLMTKCALRSFSETRGGGGAPALQRRMSGAFSKPLEGFGGPANPLGMSYNSIDRQLDHHIHLQNKHPHYSS